MHAGVFDVCRNFENDRMINFTEDLEDRALKLYKKLQSDSRDGFYSTILWPALASANLYLLWLYSDKNNFFAKQGKSVSNLYGKIAKERIAKDKAYALEFDKFRKGKWHGMQLEAHVGFTTWNDFDMRMPVISDFTPVEKPSLKLSLANDGKTYVRVYGRPMRIDIDKTPAVYHYRI